MVENSDTPETASAPDLPPPPVMTSEPAPPVVSAAEEETNTPDVDDLQARLADLQAAMDQLQSGDLDAAEAAIEKLEQALAATNAQLSDGEDQ